MEWRRLLLMPYVFQKEIEKTLIKIAKKVRREMQIPAIIKKFVRIKIDTKDLVIPF